MLWPAKRGSARTGGAGHLAASMQTARLPGLIFAVLFAAVTASAQEPSDPRQRQAAAEAYDQGTAAYLSGDYAKAAEWFETANRLSPAAPALIQAARSLQQAGQAARAATLSLRLITEYADQPAAVEFGERTLEQLSGQLVRVEVSCDSCTIDVDGTLQEWSAFYVEPDTTHTVIASFETGAQRAEVHAGGGETVPLTFAAPPPPAEGQRPDDDDDRDDGRTGPIDPGVEKPLPPLVTYIGIGVTAALLGGSIFSTVDTQAGADEYEEAANAWRNAGCANRPKDAPMTDQCQDLFDPANELLEDGRGRETRTTILWVATGVSAAATAVIAAFFTNWDGDESPSEAARGIKVGVATGPNGAGLTMKGSF